MTDSRRCGRGHDLSIEANVIRKAGKTPECRICQAAMNRRYYQHAPIVTTCRQCGAAKKPSKARLCSACRWRNATIKKAEDPRGADLVRMLDEAIAAEAAPPWEKAEARKRIEQRDAELRALRSRVTQDPSE